MDKDEKLQNLLSGFQRALADADRTIGNDLLTLALDLARQMVREALRVKPELVLAVVRESIHNESAFGQPPQLYLHAEDAALVRDIAQRLGQQQAGRRVVPVHAALEELIGERNVVRRRVRAAQ